MAAAVILALVGIAGIVLVVLLGQNEPEKVTGRLSGVRDLSFIEGTQGDGGITPVCGCMNPPVDSWRGISFAGREMTLSRTGRAPWTEWVLSSADPDTVALQGGTNSLSIAAVRIRPNGAFDPRWVLGRDLASHGKILSRASISGYRLTLLAHQPLHLALLGPVPVGAWVPFPGSQVNLSAQQSQFPQDPALPSMVERYPPSIGYSKAPGKTAEPQAYPIGDFLGPDLVLWTADASARMPATHLGRPAQPGVVTALLIGGTFSTRIGAVPLSNYELASRMQGDAQHPDLAQQDVFFGAYDRGKVKLTVDQPLGTAAYSAVRRQVTRKPVISLKLMSNPITAAPVGAAVPAPPADGLPPKPVPYQAQERYPPLPLYAGFNVFGPLDSVVFRGVWGHVTAGDRPVDLSGSADLELDDVRGLRNADDQELLSAPLATSSQSASLEFRAVGSVKLNGIRQTTFLQEHGTPIAAAGVVLALIGTLFGVLGFIQGMRLFESPEPNRS